jgi:hypothetical protein
MVSTKTSAASTHMSDEGLIAPQVEQVDVIARIDAKDAVHRVITTCRGDCVIARPVDLEVLPWRSAVIPAYPFCLEVIAHSGVGSC